MTLAEAKRRLVNGSTVYALGHYNPKMTGRRQIIKARTTGFNWRDDAHAQGLAPWTKWPAARLTVDKGPNAILLLLDDGRPMTTLYFDESEWANAVARERAHAGVIR